MKKILILIGIILSITNSIAQTISPYQVSTDWAFGQGGRMVFTGEFPSSTNGVTSTMGTNTSVGVEASSSIVYRDKIRALYTNTMQTYNNNPLTGGAWTNFIYRQDLNNICAGSCTGGGVYFPDPTTPNAFYYISGNDLTGGSCQNKGNNRIRFTGYPLSTYDAGHGIVQVDIDANVGENITVGADRSGGYWLATHDKGTGNIFKIWHYSATTGITGPTTFDKTQNFTASAVGQSYIKFSPCMDKIAFTGANWVVVYEFDNVNGIVGNPVWESNVGVSSGVGLEFSPDGDRIYWSGNNTTIDWHDITSNTNGSLGAGNRSWSMQLGPDGSIYTSPGSSTSLGRIDNSNSAPTVSTVTINGGGSTYRGLTNLAWLSPYSPVLNATVNATNCEVYDFDFQFKNYFNTNISIKSTEATIDFGDGSPVINNPTFPLTHTFPSVSTYNVVYTFKDLACNQTWTATVAVTPSCPLGIDFSKNNDNSQFIQEINFKVFPIPSTSEFNVTSDKDYSLEIYNTEGKMIGMTTSRKFEINGPTGFYVGRFIFEDKILFVKLIKK
jgi:hypothetical protein